MKLKKLSALILAGAMTLTLAACGGDPKPSGSGGDPSQTPDAEGGMKVGLVLSTGGLGDKNFNDMAYEGMQRAEAELGISFDYIEPASVSDYIPNLRMMAESGEYGLIIGLGADMGDAITEISEDFPEQKISHVDSALSLDSVSCVNTKWQEQTFLTGVMAGLGTLSDMEFANEDNKIGVILGQDNPALRKGVVGFIAGAKYVNPEVEIIEGNVDSFNDPAKAKEIALSMYNQGVDFIQSIAGGSGMGVYSCSEEVGRYSFGVGANVNYMNPDNIVATAARKVGDMVYHEIESVINGTWSGGVHITGLAEDAVGYDDAQSNVVVPDDIKAAIEEVRQQVADGALVPPESMDELDAWVSANQYSK